ncbi:MAG TPA: hypothetical protein VFI01_05400 [Gaiellaceae bacterium]|nr:hypothetical protein [Gaiellaceae bacterium]
MRALVSFRPACPTRVLSAVTLSFQQGRLITVRPRVLAAAR